MSLHILNGGNGNNATAWIDCAYAAAQQPTAALSLTVWFQSTFAGSNFPGLITVWDDGTGDDSYQIYIGFGGPDNNLAIEFNGGNDTIDNAYPLNAWHHIAITWDGANVNIYEDAALVAGPHGFGGPINYSGTNHFEIGAADTHDGSSEGYVADVRVYNRGLSLAEVKEIYNARGSDSVLRGLVGRYLGNEGPVGSVGGSGSIKDVSTTKNHGTPTLGSGGIVNVKWAADPAIKYRRRAC